MKKSDINPMPEYFDRYINLTDNVDVLEALEISFSELKSIEIERWNAIGDKTYAEGKWTIKQILQHLADVERIFCYRALCISRGEEAKLSSFDEDGYAKNALVSHRNIEDLIEEIAIIRTSTIALYRSFTDEMLLKSGASFKGTYSVLSIGFTMAGHQRWHFGIIKEKYLNL